MSLLVVIYGVVSVVDAHVSVKHIARVRFPTSPQTKEYRCTTNTRKFYVENAIGTGYLVNC